MQPPTHLGLLWRLSIIILNLNLKAGNLFTRYLHWFCCNDYYNGGLSLGSVNGRHLFKCSIILGPEVGEYFLCDTETVVVINEQIRLI